MNDLFLSGESKTGRTGVQLRAGHAAQAEVPTARGRAAVAAQLRLPLRQPAVQHVHRRARRRALLLPDCLAVSEPT